MRYGISYPRNQTEVGTSIREQYPLIYYDFCPNFCCRASNFPMNYSYFMSTFKIGIVVIEAVPVKDPPETWLSDVRADNACL